MTLPTGKYDRRAAETFELGVVEIYKDLGDGEFISIWEDPFTGHWCYVEHDASGDHICGCFRDYVEG